MREQISKMIDVLEKTSNMAPSELLTKQEIDEARSVLVRFEAGYNRLLVTLECLKQAELNDPKIVVKTLVHMNMNMVDLIHYMGDIEDCIRLSMDRYEPYYDAFLAKQKQDE